MGVTANCIVYVFEALEPDESVAVVGGGESWEGFLFVLRDALEEVVRDSDVDGAASARDDVGKVVVIAHWESVRRARMSRA